MPSTDANGLIEGRILDDQGIPVVDVSVHAFTVRLGGETPLGDPARTDLEGNYSIASGFSDNDDDTPRPNVRVAVVDGAGDEVVSSRVRYGVEGPGVIDLVLPAAVSLSEFERYEMALAPLLGGVPLADAHVRDAAFLIGGSGIPAGDLAGLADASALAAAEEAREDGAGSALSAEVWYALRRKGLETEAGELLRRPTSELVDVLRSAIDDGIVPPRIADDLDAIRERIEQRKLDLVLEAPAVGTMASLGELLAIMPAPLDLEQQRAIAGVASHLRPDDPGLVERISAVDGLVGHAPSIARTLRLGALTDGYLPMAQALQSTLADAGESNGSLRPLAALLPGEWDELAYTHGAPDGTTATPSAIAYADALAATIEKQYPTATLAAHLADGRRLAQQPSLEQLASFLDDDESFDIVSADISALAEPGVLDAWTDPEQLMEGLLRLQRFKALDASWEESARLLESGIVSPQQLIAAGPGQLRVTLERQMSPDRAALLHDRAQDLRATAMAVYTAALSPFSAPRVMGLGLSPGPDDGPGGFPPPGPVPGGGGPGGIGVSTDPRTYVHGSPLSRVPIERSPIEVGRHTPPGRDPLIADQTLAGRATLESLLQRLFGNQDACACGHCSSVLSPAAYLVDLLTFIGDAQLDTTLFRYRGDLQDIELSCNNTHTEVPAIDLALEVLENAVALPKPVTLDNNTDVEAQLTVPNLGAEVRRALAQTVRELPAKLTATEAGPGEPGSTNWTVVDGHRRWTLTAQRETLLATTAAGLTGLLDSTGLDLTALGTALDAGAIPPAAQPAFLKLFTYAPKEIANYKLTVIPQTAGKTWRVEYQHVAELHIEANVPRVGLRVPGATNYWWETTTPEMVAAIATEVAAVSLPLVVRRQIEARFDLSALDLNAAGTANTWSIASVKQFRTLSKSPAQLRLTSLAYQSGEVGLDAIAEPENRNPAAYVKLNDAKFPWSLPLDLPLEETRLLLKRARSSRRRLLELTLGGKPRKNITFALEILGLSHTEAGLIAQPALQDTIYARWGLKPDAKTIRDAAVGRDVTGTTALELLKNVSILLQQSQLGFDEFKKTLASGFVSQGATLQISPPEACVPSDMTVPGLTTPHLDRIHRFARLRQRLGWSVQDLDSAIDLKNKIDLNNGTVPVGDTLEDDALRMLGDLSRLGDILTLPPSQIVAWCNGSVTADERATTLARGLRLTVAQLNDAIALVGATLLATPPSTPGDLLDFCERVTELRRSAIPFEDLRYVLQHAGTRADVVLDVDQLRVLATTARTAVKSIVDPSDQSAGTDAALAARLRVDRQDAVIAALAARLRVDRQLVDDLLRLRLHDPNDSTKPAIEALVDPAFIAAPDAQPPAERARAVLVRLHKAVVVCGALALTATDLRLLSTSSADASGLTALNFDTLPVVATADRSRLIGFEQLAAVVDVRARGRDLLRQYAALNFTPAGPTFSDIQAMRELLAAGLQVERTTIRDAADMLGMSTGRQFRDPVNLKRLLDLLTELRLLGATPAQAAAMTAQSPDDEAAGIARGLLRNRYGAAEWRELIKPIADTLRERRRDALVAYLIADAARELSSADEVYERYFIDVQTGSCLRSTRVLQATAAVQLFVQQVLLNLFAGAGLSADKRAQWEWMHSYRIWEANRKVFLFPENWLLPELRDDRTAAFRHLENALTEQEPSLEAADDALLAYLEELGELAQITVIAMYLDHSTSAARTLHVIGRTPNEPYRYFSRSCTGFGREQMSWSGWEGLELENATDYIMPFVFQGDLHIAWPTFRKSTDEHGPRRWEVQIAWVRQSAKGWSKRKLGQRPMLVDRLINKSEANSFSFRHSAGTTAQGEPAIVIHCYAAAPPATKPDPPDLDPGEPGVKLTPTGDPRGLLDLKNVQVDITCSCWGKYTPPGESTARYEPLTNVDVTGNYAIPVGDLGSFTPQWLTLPPNGPATRLTDAMTDSTIRLTFKLPAPPPPVGTAPQSKPAQTRTYDATLNVDGRGYKKWDLVCTVIFDVGTRSPNNHFLSGRPVAFHHVGTFTIDALHDVGVHETVPVGGPTVLPLGQTIVKNAFVLTGASDTLPSTDAKLDHSTSGDLTVAVAAGRSYPPPPFYPSAELTRIDDKTVWYLQDRVSRSFVGLGQDALGKPVRLCSWPDGQEFVGTYRHKAVSSVLGLFDPTVQRRLRNGAQGTTDLVTKDWDASVLPLRTVAPAISFDRRTPYANYNWELFLHTPLAIADHLARQQRFADARRWLHAVFDPTVEATTQVPPLWRFLPFPNGSAPDAIATLLRRLADPKVDVTDHALGIQIKAWKENPFMPHVIARLRPSAYQWHTFLAYVDLLIAWGDQLFRRDTRESVNEATRLYVLASKMLGPRPRSISRATEPPPHTYRSLRTAGLDDFSNAWLPYADFGRVKQLSASPQSATAPSSSPGSLPAGAIGAVAPLGDTGIIKTPVPASLMSLVFCIPENDKLTERYDRVQKRLFDVRHCRNIDGVARDLPLFDPPIDPLLLIRAKAAGLNLDDVAADSRAASATQPPHYRFSFTLPKTLELAGDVRALGAALLAALEKHDAEHLTLLRSRQELAMHKLVRETRVKQIEEAKAAITALQQSKETASERFGQYQKLLGKNGVTKGADGLPVVEQSSSLTVSTDAVGGASGLGISRREVDQQLFGAIALAFTQAAGVAHTVSAVLSAFPNTFAGTPFAGATFGGAQLGSASSAAAKSIEVGAAHANYLANQAGTFGGYERRQDEWVHQSKLALAELKQLDKQILAAEIRKEIAELELRNHDTQVENAKQADEFMRSKFTNNELFRWMSSQISETYFASYNLALDQARRAERAYRFEIGAARDAATPFIRGGYWDNLKKGLIAGDHLHRDLRRMEAAYLQDNKREYEITKHVSLAMLDPLELMKLKLGADHTCDVTLPETLFDVDHPGHYLRRIKSVSLTIPCVRGSYGSVNCTLELVSSMIRHSPDLTTGGLYPRQAADPRFSDPIANTRSIVTSSGQNDGGLFETNLRDERYLPFEGVGAISTWRLKLPTQFQQFDYNTISDVIVHLRYTARDGGTAQNGGTALKTAAMKHLDAILAATPTGNARPPLALLISVRHDFPAEWTRLTEPGVGDRAATVTLSRRRFPAVMATRSLTVQQVDVFASASEAALFGSLKLKPPPPLQPVPDGSLNAITTLPTFAHLRTKTPPAISVTKEDVPEAQWTIRASAALRSTLTDIVLVIGYTAAG